MCRGFKPKIHLNVKISKSFTSYFFGIPSRRSYPPLPEGKLAPCDFSKAHTCHSAPIDLPLFSS